jgi:hypothetical protein
MTYGNVASEYSVAIGMYLPIKFRKISSHHISEDIFQYAGMQTFLKS